jgi:hypothetical protein
MYFLVDNNHKVIFGWSAKCGCSHIKRIFFFLQTGEITNNLITIHNNPKDSLPNDIDNYTTIIITRNPYKRIVSGFLDKYNKKGSCRHLWKYDTITFAMFVDELIKHDWLMIEQHHFTPQTTEHFNKPTIMASKCLKCYDIENIDYNYIEKLYNKKLPENLLSMKMGHERKKYELDFNNYVYDLDINDYYNYNVDIQYFYNEGLKNKILTFYKNDFDFYNENGINYTMNCV